MFESTTGGLINAALLAAPGASSFTSCGAVTYTSSRSVAVLGPEAAQPLGEPLDSQGHRCRPQSGKEYVASKQERARLLARQKRHEVGATWCVCENGACGPTFPYADVDAGFTAIFVSGPVERGVLVRSVATYSREENMWAFTNAALDLLVECMAEARAQGLPAALPPAAVLETREDRFGGVEVHVRDSAAAQVSGFWTELRAALEAWRLAGKRGIWLRLPLACHTLVSAAISAGFAYHHATPQYVLLTRWLPASPSPLPRYGFTLIGVGGVVLNSRDEVLMVQEAISPTARTQGAWKVGGPQCCARARQCVRRTYPHTKPRVELRPTRCSEALVAVCAQPRDTLGLPPKAAPHPLVRAPDYPPVLPLPVACPRSLEGWRIPARILRKQPHVRFARSVDSRRSWRAWSACATRTGGDLGRATCMWSPGSGRPQTPLRSIGLSCRMLDG